MYLPMEGVAVLEHGSAILSSGEAGLLSGYYRPRQRILVEQLTKRIKTKHYRQSARRRMAGGSGLKISCWPRSWMHRPAPAASRRRTGPCQVSLARYVFYPLHPSELTRPARPGCAIAKARLH